MVQNSVLFCILFDGLSTRHRDDGGGRQRILLEPPPPVVAATLPPAPPSHGRSVGRSVVTMCAYVLLRFKSHTYYVHGGVWYTMLGEAGASLQGTYYHDTK